MQNLYGIKDAKQNFTKIIKEVEKNNETIIITKDKKPVAKIIPLETTKRKLGLLKKHKYYIAKDFDNNEEVINMFYGDK